jgi:tetratricopeptide (TPR) repeat protein
MVDRSIFQGLIRLPLALAVVAPVYAFAADEGGGTPPNCPRGQVWSGKQGKCVKAKSELPDADLIGSGRALAKAGRYDEALEVLAMVKEKDPVALTFIGYSLRKSGKTEAGIARYHEALALDPNNVATREYLGEGYVATGRIDLAEAELKKIEALCGTGCEPYRELSEAISGAR